MLQDDRENYYYLRLSKEDEEVSTKKELESISISSQRNCIQQYIEKNFPGEEFREICDDGYSGTNFDRPGIKRLMALVKRGAVKTIIVRDLSRFARDYLAAGHFLEIVFPANRVRFISINDNFDSNNYIDITAGIDVAIKNLLNQMYSKDLSRKIKSSVDIKKLNGEYVYGAVAFGYKKGQKKNTIVVDLEASLIVKRLFRMANDGKTITEIARIFNHEKVITPSDYLSSQRGNYKVRDFWTYESVKNILENRIYTGDTEAFKSHVVRVGSNRVKMIPEDERIIIPETHEPIISREEFFNARNVIKSNEKTSQNNPRNIFTSLLVCGCCGNKLKKGKPQNKNWLCSSARYQDKTQCSEIRMNEEALYKIILRAINIQFSLAEVRAGNVESVSNEKTRKEKKLNELKRDIENIEILITNIYEDYLNKIITKEEFLDKKAQYNSHIKDLNEQIEKTEDEISSMKIKERIGNNIENFKNLYNLDDLSEELLNELIEKIVVMPDKKIKIIWKYDDIFKGIIDFKKLAG